MGTIIEMGSKGDVKVVWDRHNAREVKSARQMFNDLIDKGYSAFRVDKHGGKGEKVTAFDEKAETLVMVPRIVGG